MTIAEQSETAGMLPSSFAQERLFFLQQLDPESYRYNVARVLRITGALDVDALRRALNEIVRRHAALRTAFSLVDGRPLQVVAAACPLDVPVRPLEHAGGDAETEVRKVVDALARRPFDLTAGRLVRTLVLRLGPERHVLAIVMHHIVSDAWSSSVFARELATLYEAFAGGADTSPLPHLSLQYADYAARQRERLQSGACARDIAYWTRQLAGLPPLEVPSVWPRPSVQSFKGAAHHFAVPGEMVTVLNRVSRAEGVSLFMTILAAFAVLLHRNGGQRDLAIGTPVAGRSADVEGLIGLFVNTLVMRVDAGGNPTARELLARVRSVALDAYDHQETPFERVVEALQPHRELSRTPLVQAMLVLQNVPPREWVLPGLTVEAELLGTGTAKHDLELALAGTADGLSAVLTYATDLFDEAAIARMAAHFVEVLRGMAASPETRISELPLLTTAEREQLAAWNATTQVWPDGRCVHELFAAQAARTPEAVAVQAGTDAVPCAVTYAALNGGANRLARHLRRLGVGVGTRVALCVARSPAMVEAVLAVLKAGAAYVPLDPSFPRERLQAMARDADVAVLLTQAALAERVGAGPWRTLALDDAAVRAAVAAEAPADLAVAVDGDAPIYVIYTSGSTGRPKGVTNRHAGVANRLRWMLATLPLTDADAVLQKSPLSFDVSAWELLWPLLAGARLVLARPEAPLDPADLAAVIAAERVTALHFVPGMLRAFLESGEAGRCATVQHVICSGEALTADVHALLVRSGLKATLHNLYGPTEASIEVTAWRLDAAVCDASVPIGRPIANTQMYVLDAGRRRAPVLVPGDLYIGGAPVAVGYWRRPALTAASFLPDPYGPAAGARLYRTGDRARYRADGAIEFLGRADTQVKVRGYRIELGEIEAALRDEVGASEAVVTAQDEPATGVRRLMAYVLMPPERPLGRLEDVRRALGRRLPEYMVPAAYVTVAAFPRTASGKVDRTRLPAASTERPELATVFVAAREGIEADVAEIWTALLRVARVGARDSFFALGGHSLLAMQVIARIRSTFGVEIPLRRLFEEPTVEALARAVDEGLRGGPRAALPPVVCRAAGTPAPLSSAQQRLWFLQQLEPESAAYNVATLVRMRGGLDWSALVAALETVARRHEVLRTRIRVTDGVAMPAVDAPNATPLVALDVVDLRPVAAASREARLQAAAMELSGRPFDLERERPLRVRLVRLADYEHVLVVVMHHIATDGWSLAIWVDEVAAVYTARARGAVEALAPVALQYGDYAAWQRQWLTGATLTEGMAYWMRQLAGAPRLALPATHARTATPGAPGASCAIALPAALVQAARALSEREHVTLYMTLLAAFALVLARYSGQRDIVVGTPVAGRSRTELEGLLGLCVNTLALRVDLRGAPTGRALLARVRRVALEAYTHQDVPFEQLVEALQPERDVSGAPLVEALLLLQTGPSRQWHLPGLTVTSEALATGSAKYDLTLTLEAVADGSLLGALTYRRDRFDAALIERLGSHVRDTLAALVAAPDACVEDLPLLTAAEVQQLAAWNATAQAWPGDGCVHELFAAQAARTPDAIAIEDTAGLLTCAELNARANRLAHHLRDRGIGPECAVGVCLRRSADMVVAALAILKAGAACLPLEPEYPIDRLAFIVQDAGPRVIVTTAELRARLPEAAPVLCWDDLDLSGARADLPPPAVTLDSPAYVFYTSGSTGVPKGVLVLHRGVVNRLAWAWRRYPYADDVCCLKTASSFADSVAELYAPLLQAVSIVVCDDETLGDPFAFVELLESRQVSRLVLVPSLLRELLRAAAAGSTPRLSAMRTIVCSGEALDADLVAACAAALPHVRLVNLYGSSEVAADVTAADVRPGTRAAADETVPIGRPIANTRAYVLDDRGRQVPVGVPGELFIGGAGLARGYLRRPALTASSFVPDPFGADPGSRMYRTGDRARWSGDGELQFLGRSDYQVKVRGHRVELGEIEAVLARHPAVAGAIVVLRKEPEHDPRLTAYVVGAGSTPPRAELRAFVRRALPEHMVPSDFVVLERFPLTPSGKMDRSALPRPEPAQPIEVQSQAPLTPTEALLHRLWARLLDAPDLRPDDDFFEAGGHSLLAMQLVSRMREALGRRVTLRDLFTYPTVRLLARAVDGMDQGAESLCL